MRKLAWRLGWLDRSIDPLDGLEIGRANVLHGATAQYVDPRLRPETRQVKAMAAAADKLCGPEGTDPLMTRLPLFGTKIRVAGFGGLRLGEQNALRAIDVFFDRGYVHVNGSWITPRGSAGFRGPVKNHTLHEVPLPKSLMRDELLPRVKELLGLPANASLQQVVNAQEAERQRRASLAAREKDRNLAWWNYPVPPEDELWLFVDTVTGLPVKPEMHNERWHRVRAWVEENDPDNAWPRTIVYRNLRHHAATKWFHEELGEPWEVVAQYLGDKLTTVLNHYVRAGEDALRTRSASWLSCEPCGADGNSMPVNSRYSWGSASPSASLDSASEEPVSSTPVGTEAAATGKLPPATQRNTRRSRCAPAARHRLAHLRIRPKR